MSELTVFMLVLCGSCVIICRIMQISMGGHFVWSAIFMLVVLFSMLLAVCWPKIKIVINLCLVFHAGCQWCRYKCCGAAHWLPLNGTPRCNFLFVWRRKTPQQQTLVKFNGYGKKKKKNQVSFCFDEGKHLKTMNYYYKVMLPSLKQSVFHLYHLFVLFLYVIWNFYIVC